MGLRQKGAAGEYELVHPRCAQQRAEDVEEVSRMIDAGETDIAVDELRWLLSGCPELVDAHQMLGLVALGDGDIRLARGHYGYAYDLGLAALPTGNWKGILPYRLPGNRAFLTSIKGLALCLFDLGERQRASEVANRLLALDPSDPLEVRAWMAQWPAEPRPGDSPPPS